MSAEAFFDTNVLLYLLSADERKASRVERLLESGGRVSVQVLNEFAAVATRKLKMSWQETAEALAVIRELCPVESLTEQTHERGCALAQSHGLSVYDAMIVSAALIADARVLYSEDFQHGIKFEKKLVVRNPFFEA